MKKLLVKCWQYDNFIEQSRFWLIVWWSKNTKVKYVNSRTYIGETEWHLLWNLSNAISFELNLFKLEINLNQLKQERLTYSVPLSRHLLSQLIYLSVTCYGPFKLYVILWKGDRQSIWWQKYDFFNFFKIFAKFLGWFLVIITPN